MFLKQRLIYCLHRNNERAANVDDDNDGDEGCSEDDEDVNNNQQ